MRHPGPRLPAMALPVRLLQKTEGPLESAPVPKGWRRTLWTGCDRSGPAWPAFSVVHGSGRDCDAATALGPTESTRTVFGVTVLRDIA